MSSPSSPAPIRRYVSLDRRDRSLCEWLRPDRYRELFELSKTRKLIAHGSALSLVGAGFSSGALAIDMTCFNRLLSFDPGTCRIAVEAGATLAKLLQFLLPRGFTLPVLPGYPHLTVGGCIAGNVHGKNQYREGSFADSVEELALFHPRYGLITINRETDPTLFDLTCGGFGLTGIIVSATLRVERSRGSEVGLTHIPVAGMAEAVDVMMSRLDGSDFLYSWHDLSRRRRALGSGFVTCGVLEGKAEMIPEFGRQRLTPGSRKPRIRVLTPTTLPLFNRLYDFLIRHSPRRSSPTRALFPFLHREAYFDMFGDAGLIEHQVLVPFEQVKRYIGHLLGLMEKHACNAPLASLKIFGGKQRLLWYSGPGVSFSLHFFNDQRSRGMLDEWDPLESTCRHASLSIL